MKTYALRLHPGDDLKAHLDAFAVSNHLPAACVLACVGSLSKAVLRYADQSDPSILQGRYEIVALTGVLSEYGSHYHIAIADGEGRTLGAHLLDGCEVYTTAEVVLLAMDTHAFLRTLDEQTGYPELEIKKLPSTKET
jgi:hypothetical protein